MFIRPLRANATVQGIDSRGILREVSFGRIGRWSNSGIDAARRVYPRTKH
jgi:hypothetical protein